MTMMHVAFANSKRYQLHLVLLWIIAVAMGDRPVFIDLEADETAANCSLMSKHLSAMQPKELRTTIAPVEKNPSAGSRRESAQRIKVQEPKKNVGHEPSFLAFKFSSKVEKHVVRNDYDDTSLVSDVFQNVCFKGIEN